MIEVGGIRARARARVSRRIPAPSRTGHRSASRDGRCLGRPAQIQIERSSGFARLDDAARDAVEKALFRPHVVNGIAQPAQVLIPIEFARRSG